MERLTKKELRTLLECIRECYPICDLETFTQRLVSRLAKIVPTEIASFNVVNPRTRWNACATYPHVAHTPSQTKIFERRVQAHPVVMHDRWVRAAGGLKITDVPTVRQFDPPGVMQEVLTARGMKYRMVTRMIKQIALDREIKDFAARDQLLLKLLRPHVIQAYRNAETVSHMQQKLTFVDRALDRLHLGLILLTLDGKVRLASPWAVQQVRNYLGHLALRGNCLPEVLRKWVKQQEVASRGEDDVLLRRSPLVLQREGKRLVIRLVWDVGQRSLILEEQPITTQPQPLAPRGLSPREAQVLDWLAQGKTNKEIGVILELSPRTVQKHLEHIYQKLGVETRTAAAIRAYEIASMAVPLFLPGTKRKKEDWSVL